MSSAQETGCHGVEHSSTKSSVYELITEQWDRFVEVASSSEQLVPPPTDSVRVMTNEQDPVACEEIGRPLEANDHYRYFYTAGNYYFRKDFPKFDPDELFAEGSLFYVFYEQEDGEIKLLNIRF